MQAVLTFKGKKSFSFQFFLRQQYGVRTTIFRNLPGPKSGAQTAAEENACVSHPFLPPFLRDSHTSSTLLPPAFTARRRNIYQCSKQALHLQSFSLTYLESHHHSNGSKLSNPAPCSQPGGPVGVGGGVGVGGEAAAAREREGDWGSPLFLPSLIYQRSSSSSFPLYPGNERRAGGRAEEKRGRKTISPFFFSSSFWQASQLACQPFPTQLNCATKRTARASKPRPRADRH